MECSEDEETSRCEGRDEWDEARARQALTLDRSSIDGGGDEGFAARLFCVRKIKAALVDVSLEIRLLP